MRMKTIHAAVAGALLIAAGVAQAGGGGRISSSSDERLVCDQPLSRSQSNSCVLQTPGAAPQRVAVIPESSGPDFIVQPEGPAVASPGSRSGVIAGSSPHTTVYFLEPVATERYQVRERVAVNEPVVVPAPDARSDAFPDPSPPSASSPSFHDPRIYDRPYDRDRSRGGPTQPQGPRAQPMME
jgi:hypothetical protein